MTFENRGIPTLVICTQPFTNSALFQARAFGRPTFQPIEIPHPLGGIATDLVVQRAAAIQEQIVAALTNGGGGP